MKRNVKAMALSAVILSVVIISACSDPVEPSNNLGGSNVDDKSGTANSFAVALTAGDGTINVSWSAVAGATSYTVHHQKQGETAEGVTVAVAQSAKPAVTINGLASGTYTVWVDAAGTSNSSVKADIVVSSGVSSPFEVGLATGDGSISVVWPAVAGAASYTVHHQKQGEAGEGLTESTEALSVTLIVPSGTYTVWVEALLQDGTTTITRSAETQPVTVMSSFEVILTSSNSTITVFWGKINTATTYKVYYQKTGEAEATLAENATAPVNIPSLAEGSYTVRVEAFSGETKLAESSNSITVSTLNPPKALTLTARHKQIVVTWQQPDTTTTPSVTSYRVHYQAEGGETAGTLEAPVTAAPLSAVISGLTNGTSYNVWVEALYSNGTLTSSSISSATPIALWRVADGAELADAFSEINSAADTEYTIELNAAELSPSTALALNGVDASNSKAVTIKLASGVGTSPVAIKNAVSAGSDPLFTVGNNVTLTLEGNVTLDGNGKAVSVVNVNGGTFKMEADSKITNARSSAVYVTSGVFTMSGGEISSNTASDGGGVYVQDGAVTIGGTIKGNTASASGGGVYVKEGTVTLTGDGTVSDNTASVNGGGVYVEKKGTVRVAGTVKGNRAVDGGGIYASASAAADIVLSVSSGSIDSNTASQNGGGVYVGKGVFTMSGGTIGSTNPSSANTATANGGGIYVKDGTVTLTDGAVSGNKAVAGGGIYVEKGKATLTKGTISGNEAVNGGGVYMSGSSRVTIGSDDMKINTNTAASTSSEPTGGGGIYIADGEFAMVAGEINGNTVSSSSSQPAGGGVYIADGEFTMTTGKINGNTVTSSSPLSYNAPVGGGVYVKKDGTFTMRGGEISANSLKSSKPSLFYSGGGVYLILGGTFSMQDGTINGNDIIEVSGNSEAQASVGVYGVYVDGSSKFSKSGGVISHVAYTGTSADNERLIVFVNSSPSPKKYNSEAGAGSDISLNSKYDDNWN